jgi:hypothetical protein
MNHWRFQLLGNRHQLSMGTFNTCTAEDGDSFGCIEQVGSSLQTIIGRAHHPWHESNRS